MKSNNNNNSQHKKFDENGTQSTCKDTRDVLKLIYKNLNEVDFRLRLHPQREEVIHRMRQQDSSDKGAVNINELLSDINVKERDYNLFGILELIDKAKALGNPIGARHERIYIYNGKFWDTYEPDDFRRFLEKCYLRMGVPKRFAKRTQFLKQGLEQFQESALIKKRQTDKTLLNFQNFTLEFNAKGDFTYRKHDPEDFLTYVLPYEYDEDAECPQFQQYLDRVVPQKDKQQVLAEFIGSVFSNLKHEKVLLLFGKGRNGKSVFRDIMIALLGQQNICTHTLESLTGSQLYYIGDLEECLLNFSGEISTKVNPDKFKTLASGESVTARYPYGKAFKVHSYGRLAFNCNQLPEVQETTEGFFRRFLIIHFAEFISDSEKDPNLADKIVETELPGIMNWVMKGLNRLEEEQDFSHCESAEQILKDYKRESDSVGLFLEENIFDEPKQASIVYQLYDDYCENFEISKLGRKQFAQELQDKGVRKFRRSEGNYYAVNKFSSSQM